MSEEAVLERARSLMRERDLDGASAVLTPLLRAHAPGALLTTSQANALHLLTRVQMQRGEFDPALRNLCLLHRNLTRPNDEVRLALQLCLTRVARLEDTPDTVTHVVAFLRRDDTPHHLIDRRVAELLARRYHVDEADFPVDLAQLAVDELLLTALGTLKLPNPRLELFLNDLRAGLLQIAAQGPLPELLEPLVLAMALRASHNEYVNHVTPAEHETAARMRSGLPRDAMTPKALQAHRHALAAVAMIRPLSTLLDRDTAEGIAPKRWPALLRPLAQRSFHQPARERRLRSRLRRLGEITDPVSRRVRDQYESNPYPRWRAFQRLADKRSYRMLMGARADALRDPTRFDQPLAILVAGCGTGRQPLELAGNLAPGNHVTGLDLCAASLAYGMRMAQELKIDNVEFVQGDLLEVGQLARQFDVIECSGVLHHMADPEAGLTALLTRLEPDGVMKLGLYSAAARRDVTRLRARTQAEPGRSDPEFIRAFRHALLSGGDPRVLPFGDFYTLSECRDLLFHEQEHQFTLPQLAALLERHGLDFLGFGFTHNRIVDAFRSEYPQPESMRDLCCWHAFEIRHPHAFRGMYQFHVQRRQPRDTVPLAPD